MSLTHTHHIKLDPSLPGPLSRKQISRTDAGHRDEWFGPIVNKRPRNTRAKTAQTIRKIRVGILDADDLSMF